MTYLVEKRDRHNNLCLYVEGYRGDTKPCTVTMCHCSHCNQSIEADNIAQRRFNVRDALQPPSFCLDAILCCVCWEKRQRWLEDRVDLRRGTKVRLKNNQKSEVVVVSWYNEEYFVDERGYCVPLTSVDKTSPTSPPLF